MSAQAAANANESASVGKGRSTLLDVLDLSGDEKLRDRIMEQAIEGKRQINTTPNPAHASGRRGCVHRRSRGTSGRYWRPGHEQS